MLSRASKVMLVGTSFAPVLVTYSFVSSIHGWFFWIGAGFLAGALLLTLIAVLSIREARRQLENFDIEIKQLKTVDREIIGFLIAYLLPLTAQTSAPAIDWRVAAFVLMAFVFVVWGTHSYHFNPVLGLCGYHFFEVRTSTDVTYVLLTRKDLRSTRAVTRVVQLSEYMLLDASGG